MGQSGSNQSRIYQGDIPLLKIIYGEREVLGLLPEQYSVFERDVRRLFDLSGDERLILSTEINNNGGLRVNIDPIIWSTIRNQIAVVWVKSLPPEPSSHQAQGGHAERNTTLAIFVQSRWDKTIQLEVHGRDSIRRVKRLLEKRNVVKATQSPLYFGGTLLEDDRSIGYYSITNGATLSFLFSTLRLSENHSHK